MTYLIHFFFYKLHLTNHMMCNWLTQKNQVWVINLGIGLQFLSCKNWLIRVIRLGIKQHSLVELFSSRGVMWPGRVLPISTADDEGEGEDEGWPADDASSGLAVAGFDLQRTGHGLPHVRLTPPDVQHWDVHEGHLDASVGPESEVAHGTLVWLHVTAAKQLRWPENTKTVRWDDDLQQSNSTD